MGECCIRDQDLWKTSIVVTLYILWRDKQIDQRNRVESSDTDSEFISLIYDRTAWLSPGKTKRNSTPSSHHPPQINFQWIKDLNVNFKVLKLLEENVEEYLFDLRIGKDFSNKMQKVLPLGDRLINTSKLGTSVTPKTPQRVWKENHKPGGDTYNTQSKQMINVQAM